MATEQENHIKEKLGELTVAGELNDWEAEFALSIVSQIDAGRNLTEGQTDKAEQILRDH